MDTILLSNIPHYHHLATALHESGRLKRYITSIAVTDGEPIPAWVSAHWGRKLEGRRLTTVPREKVVRRWLPEVLQRGLPALGVMSRERGNWLNNHLFDWMSLPAIDRCDVLHFVSSVGLYCARRARSLGATVVCDVRQAHPYVERRILEEEGARLGVTVDIAGRLYERKVIDEIAVADYCVVPSSYAKETFVSEGVDESRIFVLRYGADLGHFRPVPVATSGFRILYVGQITFRKGIHYLLQAVHELRLPGIEVLLIGAPEPAIVPILSKYEATFRHIRSVPKIDLAGYYSSASVFVLPSLTDAFPLAVLEAMACGLPVIVTTQTGSTEVVRDGEEGFVVPVRDTEALKERIVFLYRNAAKRREMGEAGARRAQGMTWREYGRRAVEMYRKIEGAVAVSTARDG